MTQRRSRRLGQGSITKYTTKTGTRWRWQLWAPIDPDNPDHGHHQTGRAGYTTAETADQALTQAKQAIAQGNRATTTRTTPTLNQYATNYLNALHLADSTIAGYKRLHRNHIGPYIGHHPLNKIHGTTIANHYKTLATNGLRNRDGTPAGKPLSNNTINKTHVLLTAILDAAIDDGHITKNPTHAKIVKPPTRKDIDNQTEELTVWTEHQLHEFLTWNRDTLCDDLHPLWRTYAWTGLRRSEALALHWNDIDFTHRRLHIRRTLNTEKQGETKRPKNGKTRVVDLDDETVAALRAYRVQRGRLSLELTAANSPVFGNLAGEYRSPNEISRRWRYRLQKAQEAMPELELPTLTLHGLRHTHITILLLNGWPVMVVSERAGHASPGFTMKVYGHVTPSAQRDNLDRMMTGSG